MTQIFLLAGTTTWTVPSDWNNSANTVEAVGSGGGDTFSNAAGGGGAYASITNFSASPGDVIAVQIGSAGGTAVTQFKNSSTLVADYGRNPTGFAASGVGGSSANCVGTVKFSGGGGGGQSGGGSDHGGGGGAAGPLGAGGKGGDAANGGCGGGGGANGGSVGGAGVSATLGGSGGNNSFGVGGGSGGQFGGFVGFAGGGGGGTGHSGSAGSGPGSSDTTWDATHGIGGGSGGGGSNAAAGGLYGGGGGGGGGGNGRPGIIVITYTPLVTITSTIAATEQNDILAASVTNTAPPAPPSSDSLPGPADGDDDPQRAKYLRYLSGLRRRKKETSKTTDRRPEKLAAISMRAIDRALETNDKPQIAAAIASLPGLGMDEVYSIINRAVVESLDQSQKAALRSDIEQSITRELKRFRAFAAQDNDDDDGFMLTM